MSQVKHATVPYRIESTHNTPFSLCPNTECATARLARAYLQRKAIFVTNTTFAVQFPQQRLRARIGSGEISREQFYSVDILHFKYRISPLRDASPRSVCVLQMCVQKMSVRRTEVFFHVGYAIFIENILNFPLIFHFIHAN